MSNKLRLIKIYELKRKVHPIEATIIDLLDGIEEERYDNHIDYMKDGISYFAYYPKSNYLYLDTTFFSIFKYSYKETEEIMKYLLEKHLKLEFNE